jgi:hypothetical protein
MSTYLLDAGCLRWKADQLRNAARAMRDFWHRKAMEEMAEVYEQIANATLLSEVIDVIELEQVDEAATTFAKRMPYRFMLQASLTKPRLAGKLTSG